MSGIDFLLAKPVDLGAMRDVLAEALGVSTSAVEVAASIEEAPGNAPIVAAVRVTEGDFSRHVALYAEQDVGVEQIRRVSRSLNSDALVPDDSPNPYTMLLVRPDGREERVGLDPESLDERDEYRLGRA